MLGWKPNSRHLRTWMFGIAGDSFMRLVGAAAVNAKKWSREGTPLELLPLSGDNDVYLSGINGRSKVVGFSSGTASQSPVIWNRRGGVRVLPMPTGVTNAFANGISAWGQIVGAGYLGSNQIAIIWR